MNKALLTSVFIFFFFSSSITAQKKRLEISKTKIGNLSPNYSKSIDLEKNDTIYYVYIGFQNLKYKSITDSKSIFLTNDSDIKGLVKDLKMALAEMNVKQNIEWKKELYALILYDFSNELYIAESPKKGSGYTTISKKEVDELIKWLESFEFGKG